MFFSILDIIDYRYEGSMKLGELKGSIGFMRLVLTPSFKKKKKKENSIITPEIQTV
jgi:hypothetical protein